MEIDNRVGVNFQKDAAGLYPQEILMLSYLDKYTAGRPIARFWEYTYGVTDVPAMIASLEARGFSHNGKLTPLGKSEIEKNEYVLYFHRNNVLDITMEDMSILVNRNPSINWKDLLWGEMNRRCMQYIANYQFGRYRNCIYQMYLFVKYEKRNNEALGCLASVFWLDLNGEGSPVIAPKVAKEIQYITRILDYSGEQMFSAVLARMSRLSAPCRIFTPGEAARMFVDIGFGNQESVDRLYYQGVARIGHLDEYNAENINLKKGNFSMICPVCGSQNVMIMMQQVGSKTKKRGIGFGGVMNNILRIFFAICTCGLVLIFWRKAKGSEKTVVRNEKIALCQNCGHSWTIK